MSVQRPIKNRYNFSLFHRAVIGAQLAGRSLLIPKIHGSNPFTSILQSLSTVLKRQKQAKKAIMWPRWLVKTTVSYKRSKLCRFKRVSIIFSLAERSSLVSCNGDGRKEWMIPFEQNMNKMKLQIFCKNGIFIFLLNSSTSSRQEEKEEVEEAYLANLRRGGRFLQSAVGVAKKLKFTVKMSAWTKANLNLTLFLIF